VLNRSVVVDGRAVEVVIGLVKGMCCIFATRLPPLVASCILPTVVAISAVAPML
jgi:hypothetical protein